MAGVIKILIMSESSPVIVWLRRKQTSLPLILICTLPLPSVFVPVVAFCNSGSLEWAHRIYKRTTTIIVPEKGIDAGQKSSPLSLVHMSGSNKLDSASIEPNILSSINELESLHRERQSETLQDHHSNKEQSLHSHQDDAAIKRGKQPLVQQPNDKTKPTLSFILREPVGELSESNLKSLCNSIRHTRKGQSLQNLGVLHRILLELDRWDRLPDSTSITRTILLKPIHVFSVLTAISHDLRALKHKHNRVKRIHAKKNPGREKITADDMKRLVEVVNLLRQQRHSRSLDSGCYTDDVPSFAVMIASDASRWEPTAASAAINFLNILAEEGREACDWEPILIGAVIDALARYGRAEDAQGLLERALGVKIAYTDESGSSDRSDVSVSSSMSLRHFGPCYDALLRAWSNRATIMANVSPGDQTRKQKNFKACNVTSAESSLGHARQILLNHMPLQSELPITNRTCAAVLQGYSALGLGSEAEKLLMELEALHLSPVYSTSSLLKSSSVPRFLSSLDAACYNTVLHACSQSKDSGDLRRAEKIFRSMTQGTPLKLSLKDSNVGENESSTSLLSVIPPQPDFITYSSMLNCLCRHNSISAAEDLLDDMHSFLKPNAACYAPLFLALEKSGEADAPDRVLSWLERSEGSLRKPSRLLFMSALRCMMRHGRGEEAEMIFYKAYPGETYHRGRGPDEYSCTLVLRAWERTKPNTERRSAAKRAENFLEKMEGILPALDVSMFNIVLNCYARAGDADKAEQLLASLEHRTSSPLNHDSTHVQPDNKSYSMVIKALANSDAKNAVDRAWNVLYKLGYPQEGQSVPFRLTVYNFNSMLRLFAKRGMSTEAEALLNKIDELIVEGTMKTGGPDIFYEAVLEALGRCGDVDAPSRAEALVTRLEVMSEMGGAPEGAKDRRPSALAYNILLNIYANAGQAGKAERLLERLSDPDSVSLGSTIKAIKNSGKSQAVALTRAESLANSQGTGNEIIYLHRLSLCQKFGMGNEAERLIQQMKDQNLNPNLIHYTVAINSWAKSTDSDATDRAEKLFERMTDEFDLDRPAYHGLLLNYSTRGNPKKARRLLQRILDLPHITPNRNSFTMVIDAYARSKSTDAGEKAEEILDQMRELHAKGNQDVEPDSVTYASVIRCKRTSQNKNIHDMTSFERLQLMRELQIESWPF